MILVTREKPIETGFSYFKDAFEIKAYEIFLVANRIVNKKRITQTFCSFAIRVSLYKMVNIWISLEGS